MFNASTLFLTSFPRQAPANLSPIFVIKNTTPRGYGFTNQDASWPHRKFLLLCLGVPKKTFSFPFLPHSCLATGTLNEQVRKKRWRRALMLEMKYCEIWWTID